MSQSGYDRVQYVKSLRGFSSQYGTENTHSYVASNIIGEPRCFPAYGDFVEACVFRTYGPWWKNSPESLMKLPSSRRVLETDDYLDLSFKEKVYIQSITIVETYHPGAVTRILALDNSTTKRPWFVMWQKDPAQLDQVPLESRRFTPSIRPPDFPTDIVRIEFCHDALEYYTELDAVSIAGSTDVSVDSNLATDCDQIGKKLTDLSLSDDKQVKESSNGVFDQLPSEIILKIFSYLSVDELAIVCQVCTLFRDHAYHSHLYSNMHLNLKQFWYLIDEVALQGFVKKCRNLKSLCLSWCGSHNDLLSCDTFLRLLIKSLERLEMACCPLNSLSFGKMIDKCAEYRCLKHLDISCTANYLASKDLMKLCYLTSLTSLNLYRTAVDQFAIISISRLCTKLERVNLGSCFYIGDYFDDVVRELVSNCLSLRYLDLWRAKSLTQDGVSYLAKCSKLESLDIGWCSQVQHESNCLEGVIKNCKGLRKLVLTANRSVSDQTLSDLAEYSTNLEQLDLLGARVSFNAICKLLKSCKRLSFLDISFCPNVKKDECEFARKTFPACNIKKSFTSN